MSPLYPKEGFQYTFFLVLSFSIGVMLYSNKIFSFIFSETCALVLHPDFLIKARVIFPGKELRKDVQQHKDASRAKDETCKGKIYVKCFQRFYLTEYVPLLCFCTLLYCTFVYIVQCATRMNVCKIVNLKEF